MTESEKTAPELLAEDHAALDGLLSGLLAALETGETDGSFARLDFLWVRLAVHIRAENLWLFPAILDALANVQADQGDITLRPDEARAMIIKLREDHDFFMHELASAVKIIRELQAAPGREAASGRLRDVRQMIVKLGSRLATHNKLEEEQVYLWPERLLKPADRRRLIAHIRREIENLPPRFKDPASGN